MPWVNRSDWGTRDHGERDQATTLASAIAPRADGLPGGRRRWGHQSPARAWRRDSAGLHGSGLGTRGRESTFDSAPPVATAARMRRGAQVRIAIRFCHMMARGNRMEQIIAVDDDGRIFIATLAEARGMEDEYARFGRPATKGSRFFPAPSRSRRRTAR
jgi:hypothetical protein